MDVFKSLSHELLGMESMDLTSLTWLLMMSENGKTGLEFSQSDIEIAKSVIAETLDSIPGIPRSITNYDFWTN